MKPAPFDYAAPNSIEEAVALLARHDGAARPIAGGQSLMSVLAFRLAAPALLVDLGRIPGLDAITIGADGVTLGARVRWRDIEKDGRLSGAHPLLAAAIAHVAHYQIRNRGTVGGSLAHADPAAEMPGIAVVCGAEITIVGARGERTVAAGEFFTGALATVLDTDELIVAVRLPPWPAGRRWGFEEFARRRGDFALAGIAAFYDTDAAGRARDVRIGVIGATNRPCRLPAAEAALEGRIVDDTAIAAAAAATRASVDPPDDLHAPAAYRRALAATLLERALARARR
ncbi:MAG: xanthine dehydrogenase family protein subunit M [Alphaproteobacteria bacterium]|nr:xanthine dehydrogenase family protein subunit M [Alphaproteobacteria bacterium]